MEALRRARSRRTARLAGARTIAVVALLASGVLRVDKRALDASYGNCQGWTGMLLALRVWLEHGINLREGLYK